MCVCVYREYHIHCHSASLGTTYSCTMYTYVILSVPDIAKTLNGHRRTAGATILQHDGSQIGVCVHGLSRPASVLRAYTVSRLLCKTAKEEGRVALGKATSTPHLELYVRTPRALCRYALTESSLQIIWIYLDIYIYIYNIYISRKRKREQGKRNISLE